MNKGKIVSICLAAVMMMNVPCFVFDDVNADSTTTLYINIDPDMINDYYTVNIAEPELRPQFTGHVSVSPDVVDEFTHADYIPWGEISMSETMQCDMTFEFRLRDDSLLAQDLQLNIVLNGQQIPSAWRGTDYRYYGTDYSGIVRKRFLYPRLAVYIEIYRDFDNPNECYLNIRYTANRTLQNMYRLYNPNSGEHFYTADWDERCNLVNLGWQSEGVGWIAPTYSSVPVYRLYNSNAGEHHYTTDINERNSLIAAGWTDEGIGWYSDEDRTVPLYRQYNPNEFANNHNYTSSYAENCWLVSLGWRAEGVGWYGVAAGA